MFPTTCWTTIRKAGELDGDALGTFAQLYRPAVYSFLRARGLSDSDADDVCQEVFLKLLRAATLANADPAKGRFRSLMLAVTSHSLGHWRARKKETPIGDLDPAADPEFDRHWVLHLAERALQRLKESGSGYYQVLADHLSEMAQDRNKLWIARQKLISLIRDEIARTCATHEEFEAEAAYLSRFLKSRDNSKND